MHGVSFLIDVEALKRLTELSQIGAGLAIAQGFLDTAKTLGVEVGPALAELDAVNSELSSLMAKCVAK
jgi:hypothetical protein